MNDAIFIVNPISGNGHKRKLAEKLLARGCKVVNTEYAGHARELAANASEGVVVAVGGDGTVNEVASGLAGSEKTLGIIPCGSGNGLALDLGLNKNFDKAFRIIQNGHTQMIDCPTINGQPFFSTCGVGLDAVVSERFAKAGTRGLLTYIKEAVDTMLSFAPEHYQLVIDGQKLSTEAEFITVCNSRQWGYNAKIAPDATIDDGMLDVVIMNKFQTVEIPSLVGKLFDGRIDSSKHVRHYRGRNICLVREHEGPVHIDGNYFPAGKELEILMRNIKLKVLIP